MLKPSACSQLDAIQVSSQSKNISVSSAVKIVSPLGRGVPRKASLYVDRGGIAGGTGAGSKLSSTAFGGNFATEFDVVGGIISGKGTKKY